MKPSLLLIFFAGWLLTGCATVRVVDAQVQSFSTLRALPSQAAFRFDRLPSQTAQDARTVELEREVEQALSQVGLKRDDAAAHYAVQFGVRVQREDRVDWPDEWWHGGMRGPRFLRPHIWASPWGHTTPWTQREVSLTLRDLLTGSVVFEAHATQEGPWSDSARLVPALFSAALRDFPAAPQGVRRIRMELVAE